MVYALLNLGEFRAGIGKCIRQEPLPVNRPGEKWEIIVIRNVISAKPLHYTVIASRTRADGSFTYDSLHLNEREYTSMCECDGNMPFWEHVVARMTLELRIIAEREDARLANAENHGAALRRSG